MVCYGLRVCDLLRCELRRVAVEFECVYVCDFQVYNLGLNAGLTSIYRGDFVRFTAGMKVV